jgi:phosphatidylglycerol:prolipoprotein diacylglycerol transferase
MHPILLSTPWFNVYSYGLMIAVAYSLGTAWTVYLASREGLPGETIFDLLLLQMVMGILGSRILYLAEAGVLFSGVGSFLNFEGGGLTFYGAVLTCIVTDFLFITWKKLPFWKVMDCLGNGLMLGVAIGRIGCFLNGCCYGGPCSYPWGVVFPRVSPHPLHPTQIYETIGAFGIFLVLQKVQQRRRNYGQVFLASLMGYAVFRILNEFWRADNPAHALGMSLSQWVGVFILIAGFITWKVIGRTPALRVLPQVSSVPAGE